MKSTSRLERRDKKQPKRKQNTYETKTLRNVVGNNVGNNKNVQHRWKHITFCIRILEQSDV